ncbi:MAG: adenylosuccinate synthetase, partial [Nitrososphaera sp.]
PKVLENEIDDIERIMPEVGDLRSRLLIHPRAAVIHELDISEEMGPHSQMTSIASTRHGVGVALSRKIRRMALLASEDGRLGQYISEVPLNWHLDNGETVVLEIPQGIGLGLNSGYKYPYTTSREVSVAQGLSDALIHPRFLGNIMMTLRTHPIRVGNIYDGAKEIGNSGPFYEDSKEMTWENLGVQAEITTVTKRVRRVASFSSLQYTRSIELVRPTHVFLNFVNYLKGPSEFQDLLKKMELAGKYPTHFGTGPSIDDVVNFNASSFTWDRLYQKLGWM